MATATETVPPHSTSLPSSADPEHDVDAPRTIFWLVSCTVVFFGLVWLLYVLFALTIQDERVAKIESIENPDQPNTVYPQVEELRQYEEQTLHGGETTIGDAIKALAERKGS